MYNTFLLEWRTKNGYSYEKAGEVLGLSKTYVKNLEDGERYGSWETWKRIAPIIGFEIPEPRRITNTTEAAQ